MTILEITLTLVSANIEILFNEEDNNNAYIYLDNTEQEIDGIASKFVTYRSVIEAGFPILISLFLGPWTEIHGTKWPMLLPLFGYFLSAMSYLILCHIPTAPPELLLISSAPIALVGGMVSIIMSAFSFMSKKTNLEDRSFRVAMLEASWFLGGWHALSIFLIYSMTLFYCIVRFS